MRDTWSSDTLVKKKRKSRHTHALFPLVSLLIELTDYGGANVTPMCCFPHYIPIQRVRFSFFLDLKCPPRCASE